MGLYDTVNVNEWKQVDEKVFVGYVCIIIQIKM